MKGRIGWLKVKERQFDSGGETENLPVEEQQVVFKWPSYDEGLYVKVVVFEIEED